MKRFLIILMPLLMTACGPNAEKLLEKMERPQPQFLPGEAPEQWLLAHLDVETTGLLPGFHEMIDLGIVYTDLEGQILDSLFIRIQPEHPERLSEGAYQVNAFNPDVWKHKGAVSPKKAVKTLMAFHEEKAAGRSVLLVAYNSHFDLAFIDHLFRQAGHSWRELYHYFVLDIPSMAWSMGYRNLTGSALATALGIPDETYVPHLHTGITGAMFNVQVYQVLMQQ
jgi:DNA polymerase III alpha subunit (gram-positive type)